MNYKFCRQAIDGGSRLNELLISKILINVGAQEGDDSKSYNKMSLCVCVQCISLFGLLVHWYVR